MFDAIDEALYASDGVVTPEIEALLAENALRECDLVDRYAAIIRDREARAEIIRQRVQKLQKNARTFENIAKGRRVLLKWFMDRKGVKVLNGIESHFRIQGKGGTEPIVYLNREGVPAEFRKTLPPVPPQGDIDEDKLRLALKAKDETALLYANLGDRGTVLVLD